MASRLLYGLLLITSIAMLLFVSGFICLQLHFIWLASQLNLFAAKLMLFGFGLFVLIGLLAAINGILGELRAYFVKEARVLRQLLAIQNQKQHLAQLMVLKNRQLRYFSQFKRQRMLVADEKKQLTQLYKSVNQELCVLQNQMPSADYRSRQKALRYYRKQQDAKAILALREQIQSCR